MTGPTLGRREFLAATAAGLGAALARPVHAQGPAPAQGSAPAGGGGVSKIHPFDYQHVTLRPSRWHRQFDLARSFYLSVNDDDILHGYRRAAGQPAPGKPLGGWCAQNSNTVFGQWLQGLSRMALAANDPAPRDKAALLMREWAKTLPADGNSGMGHYPFEKLVGGLVDMKLYANNDEALGLLEKVTDYASRTLSRENTPAAPRPWALHSGRVLEWYTLPENLFRAYVLTKNQKYLDLANAFLYTPYWDKFLAGPEPRDVWGVHAYSHVNSFSSAAMAYVVTGDAKYLTVLKNAYDFMQNSQTFATGGYGPTERLMPPNGNLGKAIELRQNSCEAPCCSWAAFKMARYLMTFTGDAKYGDWIERLLYNGIGAALPITDNGKNFYYADYRVAGGTKTYARSTYTCCSGTYFQAVTEYANLVYFHDAQGVYVNLYLPSDLSWENGSTHDFRAARISQDTAFPESDTVTFTVWTPARRQWTLRLRIPLWANDASVAINGAPANIPCRPGTWAVIDRQWGDQDTVELKLPLSFRYQPVDRQHPDRVAVLRGPAVMVLDATVHEPSWTLPATDDELNRLLVPDRNGQFSMRLAGNNAFDPSASSASQQAGRRGNATAPAAQAGPLAGAKFMPFYAIEEVNAYRMYIDKNEPPTVLW